MGKTILIVEDDPSILAENSTRFMHEGFNVISATDGEKGMDLALSMHPDLILLDVMLPKMNGMVVMQKIRQDPWGETVPIIILTNLPPNDEHIRDIIEHEPSYYLIKAETSLQDMVDKVNTILNPAAAPAS